MHKPKQQPKAPASKWERIVNWILALAVAALVLLALVAASRHSAKVWQEVDFRRAADVHHTASPSAGLNAASLDGGKIFSPLSGSFAGNDSGSWGRVSS